MIERIVICLSCGGSGKVKRSERVNYHNRIDETWEEPCNNCDGAGRLVEEISTRKLRMNELELKERN